MNINNNINNRTKEERQTEIKPILFKLKELKLTQAYPEIKELFMQMQRYIQEGVQIILNIPFDSYNCCIKGVLSISKREKVWVKLEANK